MKRPISLHVGRAKHRFRVGVICLLCVTRWAICDCYGAGTAVEGVTEAVVDVTLSLSVPGIVAAHHFQEGNLVQSNEVILELEHEIENLDCLRRKLVMNNRNQDWESTAVVYEKSKSISREELEKKELEYRVAVTEHEMACEQVALRQLHAPASGLLVDLPVDPGEASEAYQPLARLVDPSHGYLICNLDYPLAARLQPGQQVDIELDNARKPVRLRGKVIFISPVVDMASSLQEVKILFDNSDGKISLGVPGRLLLE
jgi:membrane fusion protein (multidrug efflux system)